MSTEILEEKRHISDDEVERIPWKEFIRSQFRKITGFVFLLAILSIIIQLSYSIAPDPLEINPNNIITLNTMEHIYLIVLSSVLFLLVLATFTKVVLLDHREEFGITNLKQRRVFVTFLLTTSFITLVYILLDIALINIYLMTLPTWLIWTLQSNSIFIDGIIPNTVDRLAYSNIRGIVFATLLGFMFLFPLSMFVNILTRYGRSTIKRRIEKEKKLPMSKVLLGLIASGVLAVGGLIVFSSVVNETLAAVFLFISLGFAFAAAIFLLLVIFNFIRFGIFFSYSNFLLIFPFIFLFYLLPGALWGLWDLVVILSTGGIDNTIYTDLGFISNIDPQTNDISKLGRLKILQFYLQTVYLNLRPGALLRILQLDFIIVVGLSAIVIGFAEGYSILAIFRSIAKGVSIAKTGRVASRSAPKIMVITSRLFYLAAWLSFFWDNLIVLAQSISATLNITLPLIELPQILSFVVDFSINLADVTSLFLVVTILAVPFYFILTSSFKFLSVSLVLEKVRDDKQYYYLLISSAFILIVTNIFADIASLPDFTGDHKPYLPLAGAATQDLLPFVAKIFEILESLGFYAGFFFVLGLNIKRLVISEKVEKGEEVQQDETEETTQDTEVPSLVDQLESSNTEDNDNNQDGTVI